MRWFFASGGQSTGASAIVLATKEQTSFNFMAAVTVCSDFGAQESEVHHCLKYNEILSSNENHYKLKRRDMILPVKVHIVKAMVFPAVMYRCEKWTIKKAEC